MREIKFRMWNPETKVMVDLYKITPLAVHPDLLKGNLDGLFIPFKENYPLMQFTGLKDKNGREIYEGDIIEFKQYVIDSNNKVNPNKFKTVVQEVKFESSIITQGFNVYKAFSDRCEIIGNIYENPELLK